MSTNFLFSSIEAAREVAYILQGKWDECNGMQFSVIDRLAFETAVKLVKAEYCYLGATCTINTVSIYSAKIPFVETRGEIVVWHPSECSPIPLAPFDERFPELFYNGRKDRVPEYLRGKSLNFLDKIFNILCAGSL